MRIESLWLRGVVAFLAWWVSALTFALVVSAALPASMATLAFFAALAYGSATCLVGLLWWSR
jgi:hypothetical protein